MGIALAVIFSIVVSIVVVVVVVVVAFVVVNNNKSLPANNDMPRSMCTRNIIETALLQYFRMIILLL